MCARRVRAARNDAGTHALSNTDDCIASPEYTRVQPLVEPVLQTGAGEPVRGSHYRKTRPSRCPLPHEVPVIPMGMHQGRAVACELFAEGLCFLHVAAAPASDLRNRNPVRAEGVREWSLVAGLEDQGHAYVAAARPTGHGKSSDHGFGAPVSGRRDNMEYISAWQRDSPANRIRWRSWLTSPSKQTGEVRKLFGSDAERYDARHYGSRYRTYIGDRQRLVNRVLGELGLPAGASVLDVACGPGHFLEAAVKAGVAPVGLDSSADMLRTSGLRLGTRAKLILGDGLALPFPAGSFDLLNCSGLIEYIREPLPLLREFRRVLKSGGRALVSSTNSLSPAFALAPLINLVRRSSLAGRLVRAMGLPFDEVSLKGRAFRLTFHSPGALARLLETAGFARVDMRYCHLQILPHPLDNLLPALTTACATLMDPLLGVAPARHFAEGLLAVATAGD